MASVPKVPVRIRAASTSRAGNQRRGSAARKAGDIFHWMIRKSQGRVSAESDKGQDTNPSTNFLL